MTTKTWRFLITMVAFSACFSSCEGADAPSSEAARSSDIVKLKIGNQGTSQTDVLATFGQVFVRGDVPRGDTVTAISADGAALKTQLDAKATNPDGSLRHGVMTVIFPHIPHGSDISFTLTREKASSATTPAIEPNALPADFDTVVRLVDKSRVLTASAKALLNGGHVKKWLEGPLVSEWWVSGPLRDQKGQADPHLSVEFGIRSYGKGRPLRVEAVIENDWIFVPNPMTEFYDAQIQANGRTVFAKTGMIQSSHARWRAGFWWDTPVATYVHQSRAYLERSSAIPRYDPAVEVDPEAVAKLWSRFQSRPEGPLTAGIIEPYMPTTGGRPDIAPLPQWQVLYLLTMDPTAYAVMLATADNGAGFSSHYRDEKTGLPVSLEDRPKLSTHSNLMGHGKDQLEVPNTGGYHDPLVPDASHQPALDFLPYLVTGDRFYMEELEFWAEWNLTETDPTYRGFEKGLVKFDQVRAQAWSLRTLAQATFILPDNDPLKGVIKRQLAANVVWYENTYVKNPSASPLHFIPYPGKAYDDGRSMAPWQDDFFTWSVGYVQQLGDVDAMPLLRWKAVFPVQRMIAPGFCWILATAYTIRVRDSESSGEYGDFAKVYQATLPLKIKDPSVAHEPLPCASSEMAQALGHKDAGQMGDEAFSPDGYAAIVQPALAAAVDANVPGADQAWRLFNSRSVKPDFSTEPAWDIVPQK